MVFLSEFSVDSVIRSSLSDVLSGSCSSKQTVEMVGVEEIKGGRVIYKSLISSSFVIFFLFLFTVCNACSIVMALYLGYFYFCSTPWLGLGLAL